mmetsp:Transcript_34672/g.60973  ORF Transcript_34672/g.60973 Transcript_34672/m.60973 type:complete len:103 (-) Transcript_34672:850-1158(-)
MFCCSRTELQDDTRVLPYSWRTRQLLARDSPWQFWFSGTVEVDRSLRQAKEVRSVACGFDHVLLLTYSGEVWAAGENDYGQCSHMLPSDKLYRIDVSKVIIP